MHTLHNPRANVRAYHTATALAAVGGQKHDVKAIYGSSDAAKGDHSNSPLCRVAPTKSPTYTLNPTANPTGRLYSPKGYVGRYAEKEINRHVTVPERVEAVIVRQGPTTDLSVLLRRCQRANMTLVAYCAMLGIPLA